MRLASVCLIAALALAGHAPSAADAPELSRVMHALDSDALLVFGEGLAPAGAGAASEFLSGVAEVVWFPDKDKEQIAAILASGRKLPQREPLPAQPTPDAEPCKIVQADERAAVVVTADGRVLWARSGAGVSKPMAFGFPQLWWLSADRAAPGDDVRVFGKMLISNPYRPVSYAFLVPAAGGEPIEAAVGQGRHPFYERLVRVPASIRPGEYELYLHNGAGGKWGWSNPLPLRIGPPPPEPAQVFNVRDFAAAGDGMADDTNALLKALGAAEKAKGGIVYLPPGKYIAHTCLQPAEHVQLRGAGQELTIVTVSERFGFKGTHPRAGGDSGLVVLAHRCGVSDMTFEAQKPLAQVVFVRREPPYSIGEDVFIRRCGFKGGEIPWEPGKWRGNELPITIDGPVVGLQITDCRFDGTPGGISGWGTVTRGDISRNVLRSRPLGGTDMISIRHLHETIVEDNLVELAHRGLCFQDWKGWGSFHHNWIAGNVVRDITARRDNASETYLFEGGSTHWHGPAAKATADTLTGLKASWKPNEHAGRIVLITAGRGLGQYRFIKANDADTLTLAAPWDVVPDASSYLAVGEFFVENLIVDNADLNGDAAVQLWGCCLGNVIAGHLSRNAQGLWLWTYEDKDTCNLCAFNEIVNCRFTDRGVIWLTSERTPEASARGPLCFGNLFTINQIADFRERPGNQYWPYWQQPGYAPDQCAAIALTAKAPVPSPNPGVAYNLFDGDQILRGPVGVQLSRGTYFNVFRRTRVDGVTGAQWQDAGEKNTRADWLPVGVH